MLRYIIFISLLFISYAEADYKKKIIENLNNTLNLNFEFEQNINGKIDNGNCTIEYPKKIYCVYKKNNKVLVSNGKSLVIKTTSSYYRYPIVKTPLNLILDKKFLINKMNNLEEKIIDESYISYTISENEKKINIFFDINSFDLIGWQTTDIYQNKASTLVYFVSTNNKLDKNLFELPKQN